MTVKESFGRFAGFAPSATPCAHVKYDKNDATIPYCNHHVHLHLHQHTRGPYSASALLTF